MRAVCFLWFGLGNLFISSRQSGGFLYESTACQADQSFYIFALVLLVLVGGRKKATLALMCSTALHAFIPVSRYVCAFGVGILRCCGV